MKSKMIIVLCLLYYCSAGLRGQAADIGKLITDRLKDERISLREQSNLRLGSMDYGLPFLEKVEVRTELDRMQTSRQEFMLRTSFNGFGQKNAEKDKFNALLARKNASALNIKNELLTEGYRDILEFVFVNLNKDLLKRYRSHLVEKEKLTETLLANGVSPDLEDYIKLKESILENQLRQQSLDQKSKVYAEKLKMDTSAIINMADWPAPDHIYQHILSLEPDFETHAEVMNYDLESRFLTADLNALRARNAKILDFAQIKHTLRDDLLLQNRFSIGLGLNIPWSGSFHLKQQDIKIKQEEVAVEKEIEKLKLKSDFAHLKNLFYTEFTQYQLWQSMHSDSLVIKLKEKVLQSGKLDPLKAFSLKDSELDAASKSLEHYEKLYKIYISILESSGELFRMPAKNYLHTLRPVLVDW